MFQEKTTMTLKSAIDLLREAGIDSPEYDARELFKLFCEPPILMNTECKAEGLMAAIERRASREPLQYIIGQVGFYREEYFVSPACLIPRSDTEILVDYAVKNIPEGESFIDLCTGSGCVAISTLKNTVGTSAIALDLSVDALKIAKKNSEHNGVSDRIEFTLGDACEKAYGGEIFALLSNPPYLADRVYESLEGEIFHEPKMAFVGGEDGGDFYRAITPLYADRIKKNGFIAYEIGYDQADLLRHIAEENNMSCEILKDLGGNDRVAVLKNTVTK